MNQVLARRSPTSFLAILLTAAIFFPLIAGTGCDRQKDTPEISLEQKIALTPETQKNLIPGAIRIAVAAIISPKETFNSYRDLLDFISKQIDRPIQLVQRKTYQEINDMLENNEIDAAFVCTGAYVEGHDKFGMELLVAPVVNGQTVYHSYIIVNRDSTLNKLEDLQGKVFAFTDPLSNTGKAAPTDMLARIGKKPESFFSKTIYTYSHDNSIKAVANNVVDAASVDSLVWEYLNQNNPEETSLTRIIAKSEPYGIPPVVISENNDPDMQKKLLEVFLNIHEDPIGKKILEKIMIERFVEVNDSIYDSVRKMAKE